MNSSPPSSEATRSEVSSEPCGWLLDWLEAKNGSPEEWLVDLPIRTEELRRPDGHVSWEVFLRLCTRIGSAAEGRSATERTAGGRSHREIGREIGDRLIARPELSRSVRAQEWSDLYANHSAAIGERLFAGLGHHVERLSSGSLALHLDLPRAELDARPFFELVAGVLERAPLLLGLAPALVDAKLSRRSARYTLSMPTAAKRASPKRRERSKASSAVDPSEALRRLIENVEEIVCEISSDGTLSYVSPAVRELLGYSPEHFTGKSFVEFLHAPERPALLESFAKLRSGGSTRVAFRATHADGSPLWLEASGRSFRDARQQHRVACVLRDVTEQRQSEQSLRDREERYRAVVENSSDLMGVCDPSGRLRAASPVLRRLLGSRSPGDAGLELSRFVHREDWPALAHGFEQSASDGEPGALDLRLLQPDAEASWFDVRWSPFRGRDDERLISLVMRDIGARRQSEESLRAIAEGLSSLGEPSLETLVEHLAGALQCDTAFVGRFGEAARDTIETIAVWSDGARAENFEYAVEGTPCANVLASELCCYPSGVQQLFPGDDDLLRERIQGYVGAPLLGRSGQLLGLLVAMSRQPIADPDRARSLLSILAGRAAQELERPQQLATLQHSHAQLEMLSPNPVDLISEISANRRLLYLSPNFKQILDRDPEDFVGQDFLNLVHPHDRAAVERAFPRVFDQQGSGLGIYRVLRGDDSLCWMESASSVYRNAAGEQIGVFISRDVSERIEAEKQRSRTRREGRELEKLEAIGRLAGGVAHDFNNLLTAIIGYADLLLEAVSESPARRDAQEVLNAAKRGETLTRQLLAFSRKQVLQPTVVDVNALVASLDRMLRHLISDAVEITTLLDGDLWKVRVDPKQLGRVILSFAINAQQATQAGGRIEISTSNVEIPPDAASERLPAGSYVSIVVADTGVGMDAATLARIFEPFYTTRDRESSSGLGLSMAYGIIRQSGGYISVDSQLGSGTQCRIFLPRIEAETVTERRRSQLARYAGDETVLVVEDSDPVRQLVERHLGRLGYRVLSAPEWSQALSYCEHHPEPIHLLLTDLMLPGMDGIEIARRAKRIRPDLRVVYMSGFAGELVDDPESRDADFAMLEKPFTPSALLRIVRECLDDAAR